MEPIEARVLLLRQHDELRHRMSAARQAAAAVLAGEQVPAALPAAFAELRRAFADHNVSEEALLDPILRLDYAWGPPRVARMLEEHAAEHAAFRSLLEGADLDLAERLPALLDDIEVHMASEERTFLNPSVLRDEFVGHASG